MAAATTPAPADPPSAAAVTLRPGRADDAEEAGRICYEAFERLPTRTASRPTSRPRHAAIF
jgi:hypothetical protein